MTTTIMLDRETLDSLADKLERTAASLTEPERTHLTALLAVGASEVASGAGVEPAGDQAGDLLSSGVRGALRPLAGVGPAPEVEMFGEGGACFEGFGVKVCAAMVTGSGGTATVSSGSASTTSGSGTTSTSTTTTTTSGSGSHH